MICVDRNRAVGPVVNIMVGPYKMTECPIPKRTHLKIREFSLELVFCVFRFSSLLLGGFPGCYSFKFVLSLGTIFLLDTEAVISFLLICLIIILPILSTPNKFAATASRTTLPPSTWPPPPNWVPPAPYHGANFPPLYPGHKGVPGFEE